MGGLIILISSRSAFSKKPALAGGGQKIEPVELCLAALVQSLWMARVAAYDDVISIANADCFSSGLSLAAVFKAQEG